MKIIVVRSKGAMRYILSKIFGIETKKEKKSHKCKQIFAKTATDGQDIDLSARADGMK